MTVIRGSTSNLEEFVQHLLRCGADVMKIKFFTLAKCWTKKSCSCTFYEVKFLDKCYNNINMNFMAKNFEPS
jgi:hypothetical protein